MLSFMDAFSSLSQNSPTPQQLGEHDVHYRQAVVLLQCHAIWVEKCKSSVPAVGKQIVQTLHQKNIEFYVDNMIVKSKEDTGHVADIWQTFAILHNRTMKVNPKKPVFDVKSDKFLGFMISIRK